MALEQTTSKEYSVFIQKMREPTDAHIKRKIQKDRKKHLHWLGTVLKYKEVIISYLENDKEKTCIISGNSYFDNPQEFPDVELTKEIIHDEEIFEDQYIRAYRSPDNTPLCIHVDSITKWTCTSAGLNEIDKEYLATLYD